MEAKRAPKTVRRKGGFPFDGTEGLEFETEEEAASPGERMPVTLRLKKSDWTPPSGVKVNSRIGSFATVQATSDELRLLRDDPDVISIEASRDAGIEDLDRSVAFVGGRTVHRPPIAEKGDSAIVGVIDTGIDILHEAFLDDQGESRIVAIWNQRDGSGPSPHKLDPDTFSQDYGTLYTGEDIKRFIKAHADDGSSPPSRLRDPGRHGTHVASIAAGRAVGALADGMAPEAKIMGVIANMSTSPGDPPSLGYSNSHIDALAFLKTAASGGNAVQADELPIAINVSLGMNAGAHDGTSALEAAFDSITGGGRDPGCVIVKSAGNERGHGGHARRPVFLALDEIKWTSDDEFRTQDILEAWFEELDEIEFTVLDPAGNKSSTVSFANPSVSSDFGGNLCQLRLTKGHHDNGDNRLVIVISPLSSEIQAGTWTLEMVGTQVRSEGGQVDIWIERDGARPIRFDNDQQDMTLSIPGTANTVITVAACNVDDPLRLTSSSSYGRTRDGRAKPDLCAPGLKIKAARANSSNRQSTVTMTGTSMAAPHVTGALALVLSHRHKQSGQRQHNARQLQAALVRSVRNFSNRHHPGFGYGVLDAEKLFEELS